MGEQYKPSHEPQRMFKHGQRFPYHGEKATTQYEVIALGVLADLCDRRGIKWEFEKVDTDVRKTIVMDLAAIIQDGIENGAPFHPMYDEESDQ